jgi:hypothetical protein
MKFLVPNYNCLQNSWLGGYRPRSPFSLSPVVEPPLPPNKMPGYVTTTYLFYHRLPSYPSHCYAPEPLLLLHTSKSDTFVLFHPWPHRPAHHHSNCFACPIRYAVYSSTLQQMALASSSDILQPVYQSTQCFFPEYGNVHCRTSYYRRGAGWSTVCLSVCLSVMMWHANEH